MNSNSKIETEMQGVKFKIEMNTDISDRIGFISYNTNEPMVHTMTPSLLTDLFCKKKIDDNNNEIVEELSVLIDGRCSIYDIIIGYGKGLHVIGDSISKEYEILDILNAHLESLTIIDDTPKIVYIVTDTEITLEKLKENVYKHMKGDILSSFNVNVLVNILSSNGEGYDK